MRRLRPGGTIGETIELFTGCAYLAVSGHVQDFQAIVNLPALLVIILSLLSGGPPGSSKLRL